MSRPAAIALYTLIFRIILDMCDTRERNLLEDKDEREGEERKNKIGQGQYWIREN